MSPLRTLIRASALALPLAIAVLLLPPWLMAPIVLIVVLGLIFSARTRAAVPAGGVARIQTSQDTELARLIAPMAEGVLLLDTELAVVAANPAAARIVARPLESMTGASLITAIRDHGLAEVARAATGEAIPVHISTAARDVVATATPVSAGAVRTLLVLEDVTELERARRARADLVANMSHELRTPVAAARALAETLQGGVDDPDERIRFQDRLVEEVERLGGMVERLLRLSRLDSGSEPLNAEPLESATLLTSAASRIGPLAQQQSVIIEVMTTSAPAVHGDRERVLEVLSNLLDNAIRHSPTGGRVWLAATLEPGGDLVRFEVSDEGPGILPTDRERVFERFYTGDRERGGSTGTGLGLAIARHIVERSGGRIWVAERAPGATLCFTLPTVGGDPTASH